MDGGSATAEVTGDSRMSEVLARYPGARRAMFKAFHIGGCASCAFRAEERLSEVCGRNGGLDPALVLERIRAAHEADQATLIEPSELKGLLEAREPVAVYDIRSREEHEAVRIAGSQHLDEGAMQRLMGRHPKSELLVFYDHVGAVVLDAAAYFAGQGFEKVRGLRGGIDAYAREAEPALRRYRIKA